VGTTTRVKASVPRAMSPLRLGASAIQRPRRPWSSMSISITWLAGAREPPPPPQPSVSAVSANAAPRAARPVVMRATLADPDTFLRLAIGAEERGAPGLDDADDRPATPPL